MWVWPGGRGPTVYDSTLPQVYTVDITNSTAVKEAVNKILQRTDWAPYVPYEFSQEVRKVGGGGAYRKKVGGGGRY